MLHAIFLILQKALWWVSSIFFPMAVDENTPGRSPPANSLYRMTSFFCPRLRKLLLHFSWATVVDSPNTASRAFSRRPRNDSPSTWLLSLDDRRQFNREILRNIKMREKHSRAIEQRIIPDYKRFYRKKQAVVQLKCHRCLTSIDNVWIIII